MPESILIDITKLPDKPEWLTKKFEGFRPYIYTDTRGYKTIGYGFNIDDPTVRALLPADVLAGKRRLRKDEADTIFMQLYTRSIQDAKKFVGEDVWEKLDPVRRAILTDMAYNLGLSKLNQFKRLREALRQGDYLKASQEMINSRWYRQVGTRGQILSDLMKKEEGLRRERTPKVELPQGIDFEKLKSAVDVSKLPNQPIEKLASAIDVDKLPDKEYPSPVPELRALTPELEQKTIPLEIAEEEVRRKQIELLTERLLKGVYGEKGLEKLKRAKRLETLYVTRIAPALALGMAAPLTMLAYEALGQAKNFVVSSLKREKYSPLEVRLLSELIPATHPYLRTGASLAEWLIDVALVGGLANAAKKGMLKQTLGEVATKLAKAGYVKPGQKIEVNLDAVRDVVKGTTLEKEAIRWLKAKRLQIPAKLPKLPPEAVSQKVAQIMRPQALPPAPAPAPKVVPPVEVPSATKPPKVAKVTPEVTEGKVIIRNAPKSVAEQVAKQKGGVVQPDELNEGKFKVVKAEPKEKVEIPPELQPLAEEAKKYKSAEEFVKNTFPPADLIIGEKVLVKTKDGYIKGEVVSYPVGYRGKNTQIKLENGKWASVNIYSNWSNKIKKDLGIENVKDFYNQAVKGIKPEAKPEVKEEITPPAPAPEAPPQKPAQPKGEVEPVKAELPEGIDPNLKVPLRKSPANFSATHKYQPVRGHPEIYSDGVILLEDRTPEEVKKWQEKLKRVSKDYGYLEEIDYGTVKNLYPKGETIEPKLLGYVKGENTYIAHFDVGKDKTLAVNAEYYKWLKKEGYKFKVVKDNPFEKPLILERNGKKVGLFMPLHPDNSLPLRTPSAEPKPKGKAVGRETEKGAVYISSLEELKQLKTSIIGKVDIEAPFKAIGAPKTGFAIKNYFSRWETERVRAQDYVSSLSKLKLSPKEYQELLYISAQPTLLKKYSAEEVKRLLPAYRKIREFFKLHEEKLKQLGVIVEGWPQSAIRRMQDEILHIQQALKKAKTESRVVELQERLEELKNNIEFLKKHKIQYVHIPLRIWLEDLYKTQPKKAVKIISRFFRTRETVDLRSFTKYLIDEGLIKPADLDIRNVIAAYGDKVGRIYALSDIFNNAKKEGLVLPLDEAPEEWVLPPVRLIPEFKGYKVHPAFMEYLEDFLRAVRPGMKLGRILVYIKILQFDNPILLPVYDLYQAFWSGSFRSIKTPFFIKKAIQSIWKKDAEYWLAWENGAFSQPYIPPFQEFQKEIELLKENNFIKRVIKMVQQNLKIPTDLIYRPLWHIAWSGDRFIRLITYHYLRGKGATPFEAAQQAALYHSDYASVPPKLRKIVNKIFFTFPFKVTMTKLLIEMTKSLGRVLLKASVLKKPSLRDRILAQGLIALIAGILLRRYILKKLGFKEEDFGVRYVKDVRTREGKKTLVVYVPTPDNILLKYYHRWATWFSDPDKLKGVVDRTKWDLHPLWRVTIHILQNRKPDGSPVYNPFDDETTIAKDILKFSINSLIRVIGDIEERFSKKPDNKAFKILQKDLGKFLTEILDKIALIYLRNTKDKRIKYQISELKREFTRFKRIEARKGTLDKKKYLKRLKNLKEQIRKLKQELEQ